MAAARAPIAMAAERSGAATRDGSQHLLMLSVDPSAATVEETLSSVANDVGHLHGGVAQALRKASPDVPSCSMSRGLEVSLRCFFERCR